MLGHFSNLNEARDLLAQTRAAFGELECRFPGALEGCQEEFARLEAKLDACEATPVHLDESDDRTEREETVDDLLARAGVVHLDHVRALAPDDRPELLGITVFPGSGKTYIEPKQWPA